VALTSVAITIGFLVVAAIVIAIGNARGRSGPKPEPAVA
jgi:hypothetical protein